MSNSSFCYIAPTSMLEYVTASKTHLTLAHLVDRDPEYAAFYRSLSQEHYVIMDNSAYELKKSWDPDSLMEMASRINADAIVLPDYPFEPTQKTIDAAEEFMPKFKAAGFDTFFVPQSKKGDLADWLRAYKWAAQHPGVDIIGMSILGIPNALPHISPSYARVVMTQMLKHVGALSHKHHHFLGLNAGPALEIPSLVALSEHMKRMTVDSSGPIWSAVLGHEYSRNTDSFLCTSKPLLPVDFAMKAVKADSITSLIKHNINMTESLFDGSHNSRVWFAEAEE